MDHTHAVNLYISTVSKSTIKNMAAMRIFDIVCQIFVRQHFKRYTQI
jgi:hypothetical protein